MKAQQTDFVLAHKVLRIDDMVSIESDDIGYRRAMFNAPYATVRIEHGLSAAILPKTVRGPFACGTALDAVARL